MRHRPYLLLLFLLLLPGCGRDADAWTAVQERGVLRVGLDPTYPPFAVATATDLVGFDVDLALALADDLGLQVEFAYFGYDGLYDALGAGQADVLISALVVAENRTSDFSYSEPYFNAGQMLIVPDGSGIEAMVDLRGRTLGVELGSEGHVVGLEWARQVAELEVVPFGTPEEAVAAAIQGTVSAIILDHINARLLLAQHPSGLHLAPTPITVEPYALVVRSQDDQLLDHLNTSLEHLLTTGVVADIGQRWLDTNP